MGTAIEPLSLAGAVSYAYAATGVPILMPEHRISVTDDSLRVSFIEPSLVGLYDAMADGVPVLGYIHWTLLDNFEWVFSYAHHLGPPEVDRETFEPGDEAQGPRARGLAVRSRAPACTPTR